MKKVVQVCLLIICYSYGAKYYVATNGFDHPLGGSLQFPWLTIKYAEGRIWPGDTVLIREGTYNEYGIWIDRDHAVFQAYQAEPCTVYGDISTMPEDVYNIFSLGATGIILDGIHVTNSIHHGISVSGDSCIVRNCRVDSCKDHGIEVISWDTLCAVTIEDNIVTAAPMDTVGVGSTGWGVGISVRGTLGEESDQWHRVYNTIVRSNEVYKNFGEGINVFWGAESTIVEYNLVHENAAVEIYFDNAKNTVCRYNLIYGTTDTTYWRSALPGQGNCNWPSPGIGISNEIGGGGVKGDNYEIYGNLIAFCKANLAYWEDDSNEDDWENHKIYNNTFVEGYCNGIELDNGDCFSNCTIKNNIVWQTEGDFIIDIPDSGFIFDYNLWWDTTQIDLDDSAKGNNDVYADPKLDKSSGWRSLISDSLNGTDFALESNSPAIDEGANLGSYFDDGLEDGSTWPDDITHLDQDNYGRGWEIGAYVFEPTFLEYNSTTALEDVNSSHDTWTCPSIAYGNVKIELAPRRLSYDDINLHVYDITGRLVKSLTSLGNYIFWNGYDNNRRPVSSGIYIFILETPEGNSSKKILLLR